MAGLVPAIHVLLRGNAVLKTWMPGTSPGMTIELIVAAAALCDTLGSATLTCTLETP
jgi:hypothetical protein